MNKNTNPTPEEEMIHAHMMSRQWAPSLATLALFLLVVSLIVSPYVVAYILLSPKVAATWAGLTP